MINSTPNDYIPNSNRYPPGLVVVLLHQMMPRGMSKVENMELMDIVTTMAMLTPVATMTIMKHSIKRGMKRVIVEVNHRVRRGARGG